MRKRDVVKTVVGSMATYLVVAACGSGAVKDGSASSPSRDAGAVLADGAPTPGQTTGDEAGADDDAASSDADGILDAIMNPEGEAQAAPAPEVAVENCSLNKSYMPPGSPNTVLYVEH